MFKIKRTKLSSYFQSHIYHSNERYKAVSQIFEISYHNTNLNKTVKDKIFNIMNNHKNLSSVFITRPITLLLIMRIYFHYTLKL